MSDFTLAQVATLGLPPGQYAVQITDIEGGTSGSNNPKIQFKGKIAQSANPDVKVGHTTVWSYTWQKEWRSILVNDLVRAGLPKTFQGNDDERVMAQRLSAAMVNQFYTIQVKEQKNDPTRTNTSLIGPFHAGGSATAPAPSVMAQPAPTAAPAPQMSPAPQGAAGMPTPSPAAAQTFQPASVEITPAMAAATPQPSTEAVLDATTLSRIIAGERPSLNSTQRAQLRQVLPAIAGEYDGGNPVLQPQTGNVPPAAASAFNAV